jgi:hypothetical protein
MKQKLRSLEVQLEIDLDEVSTFSKQLRIIAQVIQAKALQRKRQCRTGFFDVFATEIMQCRL